MEERNMIVGFSYCMHDVESGVQSYEVFKDAGQYNLIHLDSRRDYHDNPFTEGTIFTHLSPRQIASLKRYSINPQLFPSIRQAVVELSGNKFSINTVSTNVCSALWDYFLNNSNRFIELMMHDNILTKVTRFYY
jgi:hypothetical protein